MRTRFRRHRLHPAEGEVPKRASNLALVLILGALVLVILVIVFIPDASESLDVAALLIQLLAFVGVVGAAIIGGVRVRHRIGKAGEAVRVAASKDAFWSPDAIRVRVESLFEPYWRAVQKRSAASIAAELTPRWQQRLDEAFTIWIERGFKPVLFDLSLQEIKILEAEDHDDPRADCFVALLQCRTSYHVTDTLSGDVVEGFPGSRVEKQSWHFIRGEQQWLLDRVERLGPSGGSDLDLISDMSIDCTP